MWRRFTEAEDKIIAEAYARYVPVEDIADRIRRDLGTTRQRIHHLGLRRSAEISRALRWAPEPLREQRGVMAADEWLQACYAWRQEQLQQQREADSVTAEARRDELARQIAEIDGREDLSRDDKMRAQMQIGATLQDVATLYGVSRERVRQITDPDFKPPTEKFAPEERLVRLEQRHLRARERLLKQSAGKVFAAWELLPQEAKTIFASLVKDSSGAANPTDKASEMCLGSAQRSE